MTAYRIKLPGYRVDRHGKIVRAVKRLDVSARLRQRSCNKVRVARKRI